MSWLDKFFVSSALVVYSQGNPLPVQPGINFSSPLTATDNPGAERTDIGLASAGIVAATIAGGTSAQLPAGGIVLATIDTTSGGAANVQMPAAPALGTVVFVSVRLTSNIVYTDPNSYPIEDPETGVTAVGYTQTAAHVTRNMMMVLSKDASNALYWATFA